MISCQRDLFNIPKGIVYLNTAYMSPLLNSVVQAINGGTLAKANPWKIKVSNFYNEVEKARYLFSKLVNVRSDSVAIIPSASYGIETAAKNLYVSPKKNIAVLEHQFPSNVYPWIRRAKELSGKLKIISTIENDLTASIIDAIDQDCDIVSLPNVHWTTGKSINLEKVRQRCDEINAALVLDLTQSAGAMAIDFTKIKPDFAVVANYKWMLGPYSTGFLYVDPKYHDGKPLEEGWINRDNSDDFTNLITYTDKYKKGAIRFDMGERSNFSLMPGVSEALQQLLDWKILEIENTLSNQNAVLAKKLKNLGLKVLEEKYRGPHFVSAELPKEANPKLLQILESKGIFVSKRGQSLRITPHLWNNQEELDYFVHELSIAV